ncbi:MAG: pilus assembly PilX N-terminal domain-containing protein [bacterium]
MALKTPLIFKDEQGGILAITLVIMVLLTILGFAALNTSSLDIQIAGNEVNRTREFYQAEAGVSAVLALPTNTLHGILMGWGGARVEQEYVILEEDKRYIVRFNRWIDSPSLSSSSPYKFEVKSVSGGVTIIAGIEYTL